MNILLWREELAIARYKDKTLKVRAVFLRKRFLKVGTAIALFLAVMVALITYYGQNTGNVTLRIAEDSRKLGITLSETKDFAVPTMRLLTEPMNNVDCISYQDLNIKKAKETDGSSNGMHNIAYTFYLKNAGREVIDLDMAFILTSNLKELDEAIRVMIIIDDSTNPLIYKRSDDINSVYQSPGAKAFYQTYIAGVAAKNFINEDTYRPPKPGFVEEVGQDPFILEQFSNVQVQQVIKFTILVWIDGWDPQCVDAKLGGDIKFTVDFSVKSKKD